jgi:hypothetical protein
VLGLLAHLVTNVGAVGLGAVLVEGGQHAVHKLTFRRLVDVFGSRDQVDTETVQLGHDQGVIKAVSAEPRQLVDTLKQLCFVRERLLSKELTEWSREELMIGGALAGIMHGSWRRNNTSQYLSISMPNTFSMPPAYVEKFIRENGLTKLDQDVFECLRDKLARLYLDDASGSAGKAYQSDAATLLKGRSLKPQSADLIVTSPPYLRVVNYGTANWIRLWLLGIDEVGRESGAGRKTMNATLDHRHTYSSYREFMLRTVQGVQRVLKPEGVTVLLIGDVADPGKKPLPLAAQIWDDIQQHTDLRLVEMVEDDLPHPEQGQSNLGRHQGTGHGPRLCVSSRSDRRRPRPQPQRD